MKSVVSFCIIFILIGLMFFGEGFVGLRHKASASLGSLFGYVFGQSQLEAEIKELRKENEDLKSQIFVQNLIDSTKIKVYSIYPFNNIKQIAIAAGASKGIKEGSVITSGKNILVGKVAKVFSDYSIVTTIFDPNWKMEVRIGAKEIDGLFVGGNTPAITLLSKKSEINIDDIVFTAGLGFPYGLEVGRIREIKEEDGNPVRTAIVDSIIQIKDLRDVQIRR